MRDAFGGVFMMRLFIVFIFIYVAFTAVSLNYAKAFRVKNNVISFIEEKRITNLNYFFSKSNNNDLKELDNMLETANYNITCSNGNGRIDTGEGGPQAYCYKGIVIEEIGETNDSVTFAVNTFAGWNLGALNSILALGGKNPSSEASLTGSWRISGEANVKVRVVPK